MVFDLTVFVRHRTALLVYVALVKVHHKRGTDERRFYVTRKTLSKLTGITRYQTISDALEYLYKRGIISKRVKFKDDISSLRIDMKHHYLVYRPRNNESVDGVTTHDSTPSEETKGSLPSDLEAANATKPQVNSARYDGALTTTQKSKNYFRGDLVLTKAGLKGIVTRLPDNGRVVVDVITKAENGIIMETTQTAYLESELTKAPELANDPLIMALKKEHDESE